MLDLIMSFLDPFQVINLTYALSPGRIITTKVTVKDDDLEEGISQVTRWADHGIIPTFFRDLRKRLDNPWNAITHIAFVGCNMNPARTNVFMLPHSIVTLTLKDCGFAVHQPHNCFFCPKALYRLDLPKLKEISITSSRVNHDQAIFDDHCLAEDLNIPCILARWLSRHNNSLEMIRTNLISSDRPAYPKSLGNLADILPGKTKKRSVFEFGSLARRSKILDLCQCEAEP